jgi:hypothetical protein
VEPTTSAPGEARLVLPDGRTLEVRPVRAGDTDRLIALYATLHEEDLHRRFFAGYQPPRSVIEHWASVGDRGGCLLVVSVGDGQRSRVVADAGYALLGDGSGEFAVTVDRSFRGWLGPFLFDMLVGVARTRGVPNLQGDVLVGNRQMMAMMRARGFVVVDHPDFAITRVMIGTHDRVPRWPGAHDRSRVLVELSGAHWAGERAAKAAGWQVISCPGPGGQRCPAPRGEACPLASDADVVLFGLGPARPAASAVLAAHPRLHPHARLFVDSHAVADDALIPAGASRTAPGASPEAVDEQLRSALEARG